MPGTPQPAPPSHPKILLVEDDENVRAMIVAHLERRLSNAEVIPVPDAKRALQALEKSDVDLILSDFHLPDMNGLEFLTKARRAYPSAKRVMLTGAPDEGLAVDASREAGIDRFFVKPLQMEAFAHAVKGLLAQGAGRRPPPR
jgi:two-component system NtrC family sensor kinase